MGIDVYLRWDGQTEEEEKAQYTGFSVTHGNVGYLREAYHGGPYATQILFREVWEDESHGEWSQPAAVLRARLPEAMRAHIERGNRLYGDKCDGTLPCCRAFTDFVELAERKERELSQPVRVVVSA